MRDPSAVPGARALHRRRRRAAFGTVAILAIVGLGGQRVLAHRSSSQPTSLLSGPRCIPAHLNGSALLPGTTLTVSPLPGSYDASPHTQISLLSAAPSALKDVSVEGSQTGAHDGRLKPYSQGDGASFVPSHPFVPSEQVSVRGQEHTHGRWVRFAYSFVVSEPDVLGHPAPGAKPKAAAGEAWTFHSQPAMEVPAVKVNLNSPRAEGGDIFMAPYTGPGQDGPMIFDNTGNLVWFDSLPTGVVASNLQVQSWEGKPVLSWWQGYIPPQGFGEGEEVIADSSYRTLFRLQAGNGYVADLHDFHLQDDGTALMTVFNPIRCDLSSIGGSREAAVTDTLFQEIDVRRHLVRREWHAVDHAPISESNASGRSSSLEWPFDYFHINTIERRRDGNFLISARNTSAVYFVDAATGQITLQIGGQHSGLQMGSGTSTAYQHDAHELPNGEISIFDNGGVPMVHSQSRGIVVAVDSQAHTDTLLEQYEHPNALEAGSQGDMQALANGDWLIGWGAQPYVSEFAPDGTMVFDAQLPAKTESYRAYRFPWNATPAQPPALAVSSANGRLQVYASWNGATNVAGWRVLGGAGPSKLKPVGAASRSGFETTIGVSGAPAYVAVQALGSSGDVLGTSRTVHV